jgi:glutamate-1-semialdehyde 2,1-aminomutase
VTFKLQTEIELIAAEELLAVLPGAENVKFGKNGSDATTAAVKLARAATGRDLVAVSEQPFHSVDDWFIGTTAMNAGIPAAHRALTVQFRYNDLASLAALFAEHEQKIACVLLEPATTTTDPAPGFLEGVRQLCDRHGALLVFDEIITGFRWAFPGAQALYGVRPDLSCWGKAVANGFPLSALTGRREVMELGGLRTEAHRVFLLSTTNGPETVSLAAHRAVLRAYADGDPIGVMERRGRLLADGVNEAARDLGVDGHLSATGRPSCLIFVTLDADGHPSQEYRTLFLQHLLQGGVLGQSFVVSAAHTVDDIEHTVEVARGAMLVYRKALEEGSARPFFAGRPVAPALRSHAAPRSVPGP